MQRKCLSCLSYNTSRYFFIFYFWFETFDMHFISVSFQEEKRKMVASAFGEEHGGGSATRLTVEDLRYLFMV